MRFFKIASMASSSLSKGRAPQNCLMHGLGRGGMFDDRALRGQIALQNRNRPVAAQRVVKFPNDVGALEPVGFSSWLHRS